MIAVAVTPTFVVLVTAVALFGLGIAGLLSRRSPIAMLMSIELMLNAGNLALVAYARLLGQQTGQVVVFFVLAVAAAEAAVGLALFIAIYRHGRTIDVNRMNLMRW